MATDTRWVKRVLAVVFAVLTAVVAPAGALRTAESAPVIDSDAPDPAVVYDRTTGAYYAFTTQARTPGGFARVPVWRSYDLKSWSYVANALPRRASWTQPGSHVAPAVARFGGHWNLYYAALDQTGRFCVGVATTVRIDQPFADASGAPIVCAIDDALGAIDPSVFVDSDGSPWLVWKNEGSAQVLSARLSPDGRALIGPITNIYNPDAAWIGAGIENPQLVQLDGAYLLLFAYNYWESPSYATGYAVCDGPQGPCTAGGPLLTSNASAPGPGGLTMFDSPAGAHLVAYHAWVNGIGYDNGGRRAMFIGHLMLTERGPEVFDELPGTVGATSLPFGTIDVATTDSEGRAVLEGWALDPDTDAPVLLHVYVNGVLDQVVTAGRSRSDVAAAFRVDADHGYALTTRPGTVCVYAINSPGGTNPLIGCREVGVLQPVGALDVVAPVEGGVQVAGWALDPDVPGVPLEVHIYVDGVLRRGATAANSRTDVGRVYPAAGPGHGYDVTIALGGGSHTVCAYALNHGPGGNALLGCRPI